MNVIEMTRRDKDRMERIQSYKRAIKIFEDFAEIGIINFQAFRSIVYMSYPEIPHLKLSHFWNFRHADDDIACKLEIVLDKLKSE